MRGISKRDLGDWMPSLPLEIPYEIGELTNLRELDLCNNGVQYLPYSIVNLTKLKKLYLYGNPLLRLPIELSRMRGLTIEPEFPNEMFQEIPAPLPEDLFPLLQDEEVLEKLHHQLFLWVDSTNGMEYDFAFLDQYSRVEQGLIYAWLKKLYDAQDFITMGKKFAKSVCSMVECINTHQDFKELMMNQIRFNLSNCEDRGFMGFNELYSSWKLHTLPPDATLKEKLTTMISPAKSKTLEDCIAQRLAEKNIPESVEIYLFCELHNRKALDLDMPIKSMLHPEIGDRDFIDHDELVGEVMARYKKTLISFPAFKKLAKQDPVYAQKKAGIKEDFQNQRERLEENIQEGTPNPETQDTLGQKRKDKLEKLALDWLNEHLSR